MRPLSDYFTVLSLLLANPLFAQQIDYDTLFQQHADKIQSSSVTSNGQRTDVLRLKGNIEVLRIHGKDGDVSYVGLDKSELGAVGCMYLIFAEVTFSAEYCPDVFDTSDVSGLERRLLRLARFVAVNSVPPVPEHQAEQILERNRAAFAQRAKDFGHNPVDCESVKDFALLAGPAFEKQLDTLLEVPRLPVANPCL